VNNDLFKEIEDFLRNPDTEKTEILSQEDVETLIMALAIHRGEEGFTEEEASNLIRWAMKVRIGEGILGLVLKGFAWIDDPTGEFGEAFIIGLTPWGESMKEKLT
jgi:hypothetical protein